MVQSTVYLLDCYGRLTSSSFHSTTIFNVIDKSLLCSKLTAFITLSIHQSHYNGSNSFYGVCHPTISPLLTLPVSYSDFFKMISMFSFKLSRPTPQHGVTGTYSSRDATCSDISVLSPSPPLCSIVLLDLC